MTSMSQLRLLILSPSQDLSYSTSPLPSLYPDFLARLTSERPSQDLGSFAGYVTHTPLKLKTRYYEKDISIWCDELPGPDISTTSSRFRATETAPEVNAAPTVESDDQRQSKQPETSSLSEWQDQMISQPAREVREAIGAVILLLPHDSKVENNLKQIMTWIPYIETVNILRDLIEDETIREVASLIVVQDIHADTGANQIDGHGGGNGNRTSETDEATVFEQQRSMTRSILEAETNATPIPNRRVTQSKANQTILEDLEEECITAQGILGWDFIHLTSTPSSSSSLIVQPTTGEPRGKTTNQRTTEGRNEYGEKTGFSRVIEVLEAVDWSADLSSSTTNEIDIDFDFGGDGGGDEDDFDTEMSDIMQYSRNTSTQDEEKRAQHDARRSLLRREESEDRDNSTSRIVREETRSKFDVDFGDGQHEDENQDIFGSFEKAIQNNNNANKPTHFSNPEKNPTNKTKHDDVWKALDKKDEDGHEEEDTHTRNHTRTDQNAHGHVDTDPQTESNMKNQKEWSEEPSNLSDLMEKVLAIREAASELKGGEKERFAKREIAKLMRDL